MTATPSTWATKTREWSPASTKAPQSASTSPCCGAAGCCLATPAWGLTPPHRPLSRRASGPDPRTVYWHEGRAALPPEIRSPPRRLFPEGGYFVSDDEGLSALFKAGPFGYPAIAAHAHCDRLSFLLKRGDETVLGDSGTGVYHTEDKWRRFFKGTLAHNTVTVDGRDQAEYAGAFLWGTHANGRLTLEQDEPDRFDVRGSHDGYRRLADPVEHERRVIYRRGLGYRVHDRLGARRSMATP